MVLKFYLNFLIINILLYTAFSDIVTLPNGRINGRVANTFKNTTFYAYQQIPYAFPPLGNLRFQPPTPVSNWIGVLQTTENTKICYQKFSNYLQNEDCLYLNVYTPLPPDSEKRLPVLVYIHGGQFLFGNGGYDEHGPDFFMDTQKMVVVTLNYRLGPLGFLSTEDEVIPGNIALKDQQFALKWVQRNIHLFGGDPALVTLLGQSAGSASVSYHVLNKESRGLFRAAVCESGTALTPWSYQRYARDIAYQTGAALDSSFTKKNSSQELLQLLQSVTAEHLQYVTAYNIAVPTKHINFGFEFGPVLETGEDAFLTEFSFETLEKGEVIKVPHIIGMNSEEAVEYANDLVAFKEQMASYDDDITIVVTDDFHIPDEDVDTQTLVGNSIRSTYTDGKFQDDMAASIRFGSDARYSVNIIKYARLMSQFTDVYFYQFSYDGILGNINATIVEGADSVAHSEEMEYLWRNERNDNIESFPAADVLTHKRMMKLWTNFVVDLDPTIDNGDVLEGLTWPLAKPDNFQYLDIREKLEIKTDPKNDAFQSWDKLYQTYGVRPFDTY